MPGLIDKTEEQKGAEAKVEGFRRDLGPFVVAAETTRMAMVFTDAGRAGHPIVFINDAGLALTGFDRAELLGQDFDILLADLADPETAARVDAAFSGNYESWLELRGRRKGDQTYWATVLINPVHDETGAIVQHFASFVDISRHKDEEDRLRFLLDELNHRTQNTLATVQAIARQTLRGHADGKVVADFEGRILALSRAHALLGRETWLSVSLRDVIDQILTPFGLQDREAPRFSVQGPEVRLGPKAALSLAMVFHELATNAVKYGAFAEGANGSVAIDWKLETAPEDLRRLRLSWRESGGPPVSPPAHKGFGSRLIEDGLAQELDGQVRLSYEPSGVVCQIDMPAPGGAGGA